MSHQSVTELLSTLRHKYIDQPTSKTPHFEDAPDLAKLKKKLMVLEKEKCHLKMTHQDCQAIDQKIADLKDAYAKKHEGG